MINTVITAPTTGFAWIDVVNPSREELDGVARTYQLHPTSVLDCLDPEHLPKYERIGDTTFVILRAMDAEADRSAETVQDATRKVAIFYSEHFFVTIHRQDQQFLVGMRAEQARRAAEREPRMAYLLTDLINAAVDSFEKPLEEAEAAIDEFEKALFDPRQASPSLHRIHILKRRVEPHEAPAVADAGRPPPAGAAVGAERPALPGRHRERGELPLLCR